MTTATFTVVASSVPAGTVCRLYNTDNWAFVSECVSDGTGTLTFTVSPRLLQRTLVRAFAVDVEGDTPMFPTQIVVA
jgi:hypothetical protein